MTAAPLEISQQIVDDLPSFTYKDYRQPPRTLPRR